MGIRGTQYFILGFLFVGLSGCEFLKMALLPYNANSEGSNGTKRLNARHESEESPPTNNPRTPENKNIVQLEIGKNPSKTLQVDLPADRCKAGTMTFGLVDGRQVTCSVLGRGVARWNWKRPPASYRIEGCLTEHDYVDTVASDWQKGNGCWFLKAHKRCGATPTGTYSVAGFGGAPNKWGGIQAISITPRFPTNRGSLLVHSDNRFKPATLSIEDPTHSTAGCLKLEPQCQRLIVQFKRENRGLEVVVN